MIDANKTPDMLVDALKFGIKLGLDRMVRLMNILGNPQEKLKVVHIAGTNGKGSVATILSTILAGSNYKVGIFTSPYLERFSERIRIIDGEEGLTKFGDDDSYGEIDSTSLEKYLELIGNATSKMIDEGYESPTEFELVTAICFLWFCDNQVDIAILETGLGGRLDSTNIISRPLCTVITAIGLDHVDRLGDTITKITLEKAGIFKEGVESFVFDPNEMILSSKEKEEVAQVYRAKAREGYSINISKAGEVRVEYPEDGTMLFQTEATGDIVYRSSLLGKHQVYNNLLAMNVAKYLSNEYKAINSDTICDGIRKARWKGRVELLSVNPIVILDGGHNPQGIHSLSDTLTGIMNGKLSNSKIRLLIGVMADKDVEDMIDTLLSSGICFDEIICATVSNPRSMTGLELCKRIKLVYNNLVVENYDDACEAARIALSRTLEDGVPLLITGSLYLLGQVRGEVKTILKEQNDV